MAISAEQLNIILTAKDKAFAAAMDKNAKRIANFAKNANKDLGIASMGFNKLAGAAAAFVSVAAIQQLGAAVRDAANKLGDLKDAASAIGITTDALQKLQYAAKLSGVSADVLQTSLAKLSKNLGDAAMGGTAAKQSFDVLGLSGAALAAVPVDQALAMIADKLAAVENPAQRAALVTDIFGKSGLAMVNMLADGSAGLEAMAAEAQKLGVVINRDVIYGAAEAADKLDALSMVVSANLTQALINLTPIILAAAQGIASLSAITNEMLFGQINAANQLVAAADMAKKYGNEVNIVTEAYIAYGNAVRKGTAAEITAAEQALISAANTKSASDAKVKAIVTEIHAIGSNNDAMRDQIALEGLSNEERIKATAAQLKAADVEKLTALAKQGNITLTQAQIDGINKLATQHEELYIKLEMSKTAQTGSNKGMSESAIAAQKAKDALAVYQGQVEDLGLTLSEFESISSTIQSSMEDAFMGMVDGTSSAKDAFKSMAADIIKELYRVLVVQRLVGQLATAGKAGSGLLGFIGGAMGITGSAAGGPLQAGQPSVVGEHGRELFVPSSAGRVLSVPQSKAAVGGDGGVTVMQTINITTGVQQTVRAEIRSLMPQIADSAKRAVLDAKQRGGTYGSAF